MQDLAQIGRERIETSVSDAIAGSQIDVVQADDEFVDQGGPTHDKQLRAEAAELKQCFTRYAFQAIGLCCIAFAGIIQFMLKEPIMGLCALSILPVVFAICRLGTYKYTGSNRANGYQLYLGRTLAVPAEFRGRWKPEYRQLSWEEAMDAWRFVQPTLFEVIYRKSRLGPDRFNPKLKLNSRSSVWFLPAAEVEASSRAKWFSGGYLENMLGCLYLLAYVAVAVLGWSAYEFFILPRPSKVATPPWFTENTVAGLPTGFWICAIAFLCALVVTRARERIDRAKRQNLGRELLSIPSCALVWQAVAVAHYTALEKARQYRLSTSQLTEIIKKLRGRERKDALSGNAEVYVIREQQRRAFDFVPDGLGMTGYTFWLGQEAASLAAHPLDIHGWIANRCTYQ